MEEKNQSKRKKVLKIRKEFLIFGTAALLIIGGAVLIPSVASSAGESVASLKQEIDALRAEVSALKAAQSAGNLRAPASDATGVWDRRSSDFWDPFAEMRHMQDRMNRLFADSFMRSSLFGDTQGATGFGAFYEPELEVRDKKDHYEVSLDLPGLEKDKINIEVTEHAITISGERKFEQTEEDAQKGFYRMERSYGSFHRSIPIPDDADPGNVKADYKHGVLKITMAKKPEQPQGKEGRTIAIS